MLGGDNMDLTLAHVVAQKLAAQGKELDRWQLNSLTHACRAAKEQLLSNASVEALPETAILGGGGGAASITNMVPSADRR